MSKLKIIFIFILLVSYLNQISCSIILPTIAHYKNKRTPALSEMNNYKALKKIHTNDKIRITKTDGEIIQGAFIMISKHDDAKYASLYDMFKRHFSDFFIPNINEPVTVLLKSNKKIEGGFAGFDFYQIIVQSNSGDQIVTVDILEIQEITFNNHVLHLQQIMELFSNPEKRVPIYSCISYKANKTQYTISFNEISTLEKMNKKYSVWGYFLFGLLGDSLLIFCALTYAFASIGAGLR